MKNWFPINFCLSFMVQSFQTLLSLFGSRTFIVSLQKSNFVVAIKSITKKSLAKSQNLLGKEIKILKVRLTQTHFSCCDMLNSLWILKIIFLSWIQELTELHHENVVALLDCKVSKVQSCSFYFIHLKRWCNWTFISRSQISMSSLLWNTVMVEILQII